MNITRKSFIKSSSLMAGAAVVSSLANKGVASPISANDKLNIALIGCRNMGWGDLSALLPYHNDVRCVALCDVDQTILNKRGADLEKIHNQKAALYGDYRRIIDRKDIDMVIVATPDHWHCLPMVEACQAGKDVYLQKPIGNTIAECNVMVDAAKKYNRVIQVGHHKRSAKHLQEMVEYVQSGKLGKIGRVHLWANFNYGAIEQKAPISSVPDGVDYDMWLGPAAKTPFTNQRFHRLWRMFWNYGGGLITDAGTHLFNQALAAMDVKGMPLKVTASGGNHLFPNGAHETFDTMTVTYQFDDFLLEWENNAGVETGPYGKTFGVAFRGTNGTLVANWDDWEVYPEGNKLTSMKVKTTDSDHRDHLSNFLACVKSRNTNTVCPIEEGSLASVYAHLGNISTLMGGAPLVYDDKSRKFVNNPEADKHLYPTYRAPWKFPTI